MKKSVAVSSAITAGQKISIALTIHSVDGSLWDFYRVKISIALAIHSLDPIRSLDHSLSARLIPAYGFGLVRLSVQSNRCTLYKVELTLHDIIRSLQCTPISVNQRRDVVTTVEPTSSPLK